VKTDFLPILYLSVAWPILAVLARVVPLFLPAGCWVFRIGLTNALTFTSADEFRETFRNSDDFIAADNS
jgi:hypothetical protein